MDSDLPWECFLLHPLIGIVAFWARQRSLPRLSQRTPHQGAVDRGLIQEPSCLGPVDLVASQRRSDPRARNGICCAFAWSATHGEALIESASAGERGGTLLAISKFLRMAIQVAIMGVGAYLAIGQEISGGVLFAASLIVGRALAPVEAAVSQWRALVSARTSFSRLDEALKTRTTQRRPMRCRR